MLKQTGLKNLKTNNTKLKTHQYTITKSIMFLEQSMPHFLTSSRQPVINLARKDTATVFQRHYAPHDIL